MKNLHLIKKLVVMVLSLAMVMTTFAVPSFAAENKVATIKGVEGSATVTGYQFVEQNSTTYKWKPLGWVGGTNLTDDSGFTFTHGNQTYTYYYESTDYGSGAKDNKPALEALANKARTAASITSVPFTAKNKNDKTTDFTGTLDKLGSYLVVVDSDNTDTDSVTVYSPMVVSMAYALDNMGTPNDPKDDEYTMQAGSFTVANAKKSNAGFDKVIKVKADSENQNSTGGNKQVTGEDNNKGDTLKPGDVTTFQVTATAPAYSEDFFITKGEYKGPTVKITDELFHLTLVEEKNGTRPDSFKKSFVVKFNGAALAADKYTLTPAADGKSFELVVTDKATLKAGGDYVIEYDAVLDADALTGFDANTNKATYEYTRKPGVGTDGKPFNNKEDEITFHYTFDIDGNINGQDEGREIIKVGIDNYTGDLVTSEKNFTSAQKPLAGAKFVLVKKNTDEVVCAAVSAADGRLKAHKTEKVEYKGKEYTANGLTKIDAGEYELIETFAPDPYKVNSTKIPVVIEAKLYDQTVTKDDGTLLHKKGMLESYSVKVNNEDTNTYTWKNDGTDAFKTVYKYTDKNGQVVETTSLGDFLSGATNIVNTNIGTLPSTGGMGTILFTIIGIAIMALAAFFLFGSRRKKQEATGKYI